MTTIREFSPAGPCLNVGELVGETAKFYRVRDRNDTVRRVAKKSVHVEPCRCCRDHEQTMYPNGYMD